MKRKVQAQRKFAQGAHIPPNNVNNVSVDRKADLALQDSKLHPHLQPVVLLKRLQDKPTIDVLETSKPKPEIEQPDVIVRFITSLKPVTNNKCTMLLRSQSRTSNGPNKKRFKRIPKKILQQQQPSRLDPDFDTEDDQPLTFYVKRVTAKKSKGNITTAVKTRGKSMIIPSDKPRPVTRKSRDKIVEQPREKSPAKEEQSAVMEKNEAAPGTLPIIISVSSVASQYNDNEEKPRGLFSIIEETSAVVEENEAAPGTLPIIISDVVGSVAFQSCHKNEEKPLEQLDITEVSSEASQSCNDNEEKPQEQLSIIEDNETMGTFQSYVSSVASQSCNDNDEKPQEQLSIIDVSGGANLNSDVIKCDEVTRPSAEGNNNIPDLNEDSEDVSDIICLNGGQSVLAPSTLPTFYSFNEIDRWICKSLQQEDTFKVPEQRNKKITVQQPAEIPANAREHTKILKTSRSSPCPSESYATVRDVVHAPKRSLERRCKRCTHCLSVDKIMLISDIQKQFDKNLNSNLNENESDIYEFNADNDANNVRSQTYTSKRKERIIGTYQNLNGNGEKVPDEKLYVDWSKDSPSAIEIHYIWVEEKKSVVTSVNVVPKTPQLELTELELRENESTFETILSYIKNLPSRALAAKNKKRKEMDSKKSENGETSRPVRGNEPEAGCSNMQHVGHTRKSYKAKQVDAPVFYPTESQFKDPIAYFNEIMPTAAKFGMCKVVAPFQFKPKCTLNDDIRFGVTNQYIARLYARWGPGSREMSAIKAYLASQSVIFTRPPLLEGMEVNLPKLYHLVQRSGGLKKVIEKKRWSRVADEMRLTKTPTIEKKLDQIYFKYILPYDTLSNKERQEMLNAVEVHWNKKNQRMLDRAMNPLHRQKRLLGESESSEDENDDDNHVSDALAESEDCVVSGRHMNLATFKKIAAKAMETFFSSSNQPSPPEVENAYWKSVLLGTDHVCVNTASIDTGEEGYGFTTNQRDPYGKHPWNLKMLSQNSGNILRSLGPILGVTVPTLHLGMVYSTSCWHRDPHGLPWVEYMHTGPGKIWYGIADEQSSHFRKAVELLCPTSCQNKSIWLPSDITMIPPKLLLEHNVSISRVVQKPGEFIVVFPKAYSSSISTGYTESESAYFATISWLKCIHQVFHEVRESCEPTMFSLEQLLLSVARDPRASLSVLQQVHTSLNTIIDEELRNRAAIIAHKVQSSQCKQSRKRPAGAWNIREQDECHICRATLYLSRVRGLTEKKSSVCLQHGLRLLETTPRRLTGSPSVEMEIFFTETELGIILLEVQNRLLD